MTAGAAAPAQASAEAQASFYEGEVPAFVAPHLERLYRCVMTTVARFEIDGEARQASTWVVRERGEVTCVFLFRREGRAVTVLNQQVSLGAGEIARFVRAVFARYPDVALVAFYAIDTDVAALPWPVQRCACLEDIALALPSTGDAYLASLGKNTRASLKRYHGKLLRDFPDFRFDVYRDGAASAQQVRQIVAFSQARMRAKGQPCFHNDESTERLVRLVARYGVVGVATIGSRICAGIICLQVADSYLMKVVAHDPRYDAWRLGKLCCYLSIRDAIAHGGKQYHFGWGRNAYKYQLLGRHKDLYRVELYRSRLRMLLHAPRVLRTAAAALRRRANLRIAEAAAGTGLGDRCIVRAAGAARWLKRAVRGR